MDQWWTNLPGYPPREGFPDLDREHVIYYPSDLGTIDPATIWAKRPICCYVQIPFCEQICDFCVFLKFPNDQQKQVAYLAALKREIDFYARMPHVQDSLVGSLFFGGGTPLVLSGEQLSDLIGHLRDRVPFAKDAEIEMEAHPLTVDREKLETLRQGGVTRISFGIQSFNDDVLHIIGSPHQGSEAIRAVQLAHEAGFPKIGIDLLFSKPGETTRDLIADVGTAIQLHPTSVSCYRLRVVPHTPLAKRAAGLRMHDRESMYELWKGAVQRFASGGYHQYGSTEFARAGGESRYYQGYCQAPQQEVLGFGVGTASYMRGHVYVNIHNLAEYIQTVNSGRLPVLMGRRLNAAEAISRYVVLGVKAMEVSKPRFAELFGFGMDDMFPDQLRYLEGHGLVTNSDEALRLTTPLGTFYANNVCKRFFTPNNWGKPQPLRLELIGVELPSLTRESSLNFSE